MTSKLKTVLVLLNLKFEISMHNWNAQPSASRLQYFFAHAFEKHDRKWSEKYKMFLKTFSMWLNRSSQQFINGQNTEC